MMENDGKKPLKSFMRFIALVKKHHITIFINYIQNKYSAKIKT